MLNIYIDGDGCAVKDETYKVATRYKMKVFVVANKRINLPLDSNVEMVVVSGGFDAADDWIADNISEGDIAITSDIPLASRCLLKKARVLGPKGNEFTEDNIGSALAMRELMTNLRHMGEMKGGPSAMDKKARSQFLSQLDQIIQSIRNEYPKK
ncbi:MAG: YaiI/YqxD family protein [Pseudobdellovibrionaceae bacterium]